MSTDKVDEITQSTSMDEMLFEIEYEGDKTESRFRDFLLTFRECPAELLKSSEDLEKESQIRSREAAGNTLEQIGDFVKGIDTEFKGVTREEFESARRHLQLRIDHIVKYPDGMLPDSIKQLQPKVTEAARKVDTLASDPDPDYPAAMRALVDDLRETITSTEKVLRPHDSEMRKYYKELKALTPRIEYAQKIHSDGDLGTKAWKTEAETFHSKKTETVSAQNDRLFKKARERLAELKVTIDELMDKRLQALATARSEADQSASKTRAYLNQLEDVEVSHLPSEEQVELLKTLRTKKGTESNDNVLKTRCKLLRNMKLNAEFEKEDRKKRAQVVSRLMDLEQFKEAEKNWKDWSKTDDGVEKQKRFLVAAAKIQCEILGHPEPKIVFDRQRECDTCSSHGQPQDGCVTCNGILPGSTTFSRGSTVDPPCNHCGEDDYDEFSSDEGCCGSPPEGKPGTPSPININTVPESSFGEFQEVLDSIMHENTHAYQMHLVYDRIGIPPLTDPGPAPDRSNPKYADIDTNPDTLKQFNEDRDEHNRKLSAWNNRLKPEDGDLYRQAMMFYENEKAYVGPSTSDAIDDGKTYRHEPLEEHAWAFGPSVARQSLIRRKHELDSLQTTREQYVEIDSIEQSKPIKVVLKDRHGLDSGDEVTIDKVEGMTEVNGKTFKVKSTPSEVSLSLKGDSRTYTAYTKGGRIRVETRPKDLD